MTGKNRHYKAKRQTSRWIDLSKKSTIGSLPYALMAGMIIQLANRGEFQNPQMSITGMYR
jgi:hypothetical protein